MITNLRMELFEALPGVLVLGTPEGVTPRHAAAAAQTRGPARGCPGVPVLLAAGLAPGEGVGVQVGVGDGTRAPELELQTIHRFS